MFFSALKSFVTAIFIFAFGLFSKAQQVHFVYLQTEGGQPFYVKVNNKVISSSSAGYLILPKLTDGDYKLSVGFPKNEFPEGNYQFSINNKNEGFLLKNFGEKGWGLFNLESYNVIMGGNTNTAPVVSKNLQDDAFSKMLANVVKDSAILQKAEPVTTKPVVNNVDTMAVAKTEPIVNKTNSDIAKADSNIAKADSNITKADSNITATNVKVTESNQSLLSPATLLLSKKNKDGMEVVYVDNNGSSNDTIRIFIPAEKQIVKVETPVKKIKNIDTTTIQNEQPTTTPSADSSLKAEKPLVQSISDSAKGVPPVTGENTVSTENNDSPLSKKSGEALSAINQKDSMVAENKVKADDTTKDKMVVLPKVVTSSKINSDCRAFADNNDFLKLRKRMASENSENNMIKIAKRAFRSECFSTEQIKNLSFLFLTNEGKYRFFDEAYAFASDSNQFYTLQSQLTDIYYINRFKAMIHK